MYSVNLTPQKVDLNGYGGDTLPVRVVFPPGYVAGRMWRAQVRSTTSAATVDAEFQILLGDTEDDPVTLLLDSDTTRALVTEAAAVRRLAAEVPRPMAAGDPIATYTGVWDCQLAPDGGGDPTTTVARGRLTITLDVTRLP